MRHTRLMSAALVVVAAGAAACSGTDTVVTPDISDSSSIQATFALDSVNARALPVEMRHDATGSMSVTRGQLALALGNFQQILTLSETSATGATSTRDAVTRGTFTLKGDQLHFQASDGGAWDGTYNRTRIEYSVSGNSGRITFTFGRH